MSGVWSERPTGTSKPLAQTRHRAEVHVLRRAGVFRRALQDQQRRAAVAQHSERALDVLEARHPGRQRGRASRSRRPHRAAAGSSPRPTRSCTAGMPTSSSSSTASTENGDEKKRRPRSSACAFSRRCSSGDSSIRFVNSYRGSSKCGGVGVEGSISASAMCVWNFTASAPASAAASMSALGLPGRCRRGCCRFRRRSAQASLGPTDSRADEHRVTLASPSAFVLGGSLCA